MSRILLFLYVALHCCLCQQSCLASKTSVESPTKSGGIYSKVPKFAYKLVAQYFSGYREVEKAVRGIIPKTAEAQNISAGQLELIQKLDTLSTDFREGFHELKEMLNEQIRDKLTQKTDMLSEYVADINFLYLVFINIYKIINIYSPKYLKQYAFYTTTHRLGELRSTIQRMHNILIQKDIKGESIIHIIAKHKWVSQILCLRQQTPQQLIYSLYDTVITSHMKGLLLVLFSFKLREAFENESYAYVMQNEFNHFLSLTTNTYLQVSTLMKTASTELYKCNPRTYKKGTNYLKLGPVFQIYFVYQFDTTLPGWKVPFTSCEKTSGQYVRCYKSLSCQNQPQSKICEGQLQQCKFIDKQMQFCHSPENSDRRYEWMKSKNGLLYGHEEATCDNTQGVGSISLIAYTCLCNCVSPNQFEDRHFSLQNVMANIQDNKVVTGLRFVKRNYTFYIQIQQGLLGPNGTITDTPEWVEVNEISNAYLLSKNVSSHYYKVIEKASRNNYYKKKYDSVITYNKNDLVYTVTFTQDTVFLDTLQLNKKEVVVGVRFKQVDDNLKLEIIGAPFDYSTGQLNTKKLRFVSNDNKREQRKETYAANPEDPIRSKTIDIFSDDNSYVKFGMTDLAKDLGQNTIPYIDAQKVISQTPLPLSGVGIYYKAEKGFGGFLGLKLVHYNLATYF